MGELVDAKDTTRKHVASDILNDSLETGARNVEGVSGVMIIASNTNKVFIYAKSIISCCCIG